MNNKQTNNNKEKFYFFNFLNPTRIDLGPTYFQRKIRITYF